MQPQRRRRRGEMKDRGRSRDSIRRSGAAADWNNRGSQLKLGRMQSQFHDIINLIKPPKENIVGQRFNQNSWLTLK